MAGLVLKEVYFKFIICLTFLFVRETSVRWVCRAYQAYQQLETAKKLKASAVVTAAAAAATTATFVICPFQRQVDVIDYNIDYSQTKKTIIFCPSYDIVFRYYFFCFSPTWKIISLFLEFSSFSVFFSFFSLA